MGKQEKKGTPEPTTQRLAITMGDPRGVGPEIVAKAASDGHLKNCIVVGDASLLERTATKLRLSRGLVDVFHIPSATSEGGVAFVAAAHEMAIAGVVGGIVTAPIQKLPPFRKGGEAPGHTELLSVWSGISPSATMLMVSPRLRIALVTNHLPLSRVSRAITRDSVLLAITRTHAALSNRLGIGPRPRILVLGLNPHAGENGKLGDEEARAIAPAVAAARKLRIDVEGPLPADSALFYATRHARSARPGSSSKSSRTGKPEWDAVVAMYHDQGLIPAKLEGFGDAVNVSLGLPYVRTSVDHGTAYDIAGKGVAEPDSLIAAVALARKLLVPTVSRRS